jgi:hypothetical protein
VLRRGEMVSGAVCEMKVEMASAVTDFDYRYSKSKLMRSAEGLLSEAGNN